MQRHATPILLCLAAMLTSLPAHGQEPLQLPRRWVATTDSASQCVMLLWDASTDQRTYGYHICTGVPCTDYDSIFGRTDTTLLCIDHPSTEVHNYRLHVFDSNHNASALTPTFSNIVLEADVPDCATTVNTSWTAYEGMPGGVGQYRLLVKQEPFEHDFSTYLTIDTTAPRHHSFQMSPGSTRIMLRAEAISCNGEITAESNTVTVVRRTVDTARFFSITDIRYDSLLSAVRLTFDLDTDFLQSPYRLWRSTMGEAWRVIATFNTPPSHYTDAAIGLYDSLQCYQLSVTDGCGMNERYSPTRCVKVPPPPPSAAAFPNIIIAGQEGSLGAFRPHTTALAGDIYELDIFDRNGTLIFHTNDPSAEWRPNDSTPQGAYAYNLRLRFRDNMKHTFTGTVMVIH